MEVQVKKGQRPNPGYPNDCPIIPRGERVFWSIFTDRQHVPGLWAFLTVLPVFSSSSFFLLLGVQRWRVTLFGE